MPYECFERCRQISGYPQRKNKKKTNKNKQKQQSDNEFVIPRTGPASLEDPTEPPASTTIDPNSQTDNVLE